MRRCVSSSCSVGCGVGRTAALLTILGFKTLYNVFSTALTVDVTVKTLYFLIANDKKDTPPVWVVGFSIAMQVAASEAKRGHEKLAQEIRALVDYAKLRKSSKIGGQIIHFVQPTGEAASLLDEVQDNRKISDLIMNKALSERIKRIVEEHKNITLIKASNLKPRQRLLFTGPPDLF